MAVVYLKVQNFEYSRQSKNSDGRFRITELKLDVDYWLILVRIPSERVNIAGCATARLDQLDKTNVVKVYDVSTPIDNTSKSDVIRVHEGSQLCGMIVGDRLSAEKNIIKYSTSGKLLHSRV